MTYYILVHRLPSSVFAEEKVLLKARHKHITFHTHAEATVFVAVQPVTNVTYTVLDEHAAIPYMRS